MMNPEIKRRWVEALRSGDYKQVRHGLKIGRGHCCLGVLCEVYFQDHEDPLGRWKHGSAFGNKSSLPPSVLDWSGLNGSGCEPGFGPVVSIRRHRDSLAALNDGGATFAEIALAIEEQL